MAIPLITAPNLREVSGLVHGFTTRDGGVSEGPYRSLNLGAATGDDDDRMRENHRRLATEIGVPEDAFLGLRQVHGGRVVLADPDRRTEDPLEGFRIAPDGDAILTDQTGPVLFVRVADCFPILLVDEKRRALAVCHAGWRGTLAKIVPNAVASMKENFGTDPADLRMAVGPGIGRSAFEVSIAIAEMFEEQVDGTEAEISRGELAAWIDLATVNVRLAMGAGVRADRIWSSGLCTRNDPDRFFSYRRDGKKTGRMIGFLGWRS
jgi:polyphenol oxidase